MSPQAIDKIDAFMRQCVHTRAIVGMNLAIVRGHSILYTKGYRYMDFYNSEPVTDRTLFGIASLTKGFTSQLLGQVLKEHR